MFSAARGLKSIASRFGHPGSHEGTPCHTRRVSYCNLAKQLRARRFANHVAAGKGDFENRKIYDGSPLCNQRSLCKTMK